MDEKTQDDGLSKEKIDALKQRYGDSLFRIEAPNGATMVFRKPPKAVWGEFIDTITRDKASKAACIAKCVLQCVVYPSSEETAAIMDAFPAFPASVNNELAKLAGQSEELDVKKL